MDATGHKAALSHLNKKQIQTDPDVRDPDVRDPRTIDIQVCKQDKCMTKMPSTRVLCILASVIVWIGSGMVVLCVAEELHWISALYVLAQMITTIGYGDLTVQSSDGTKLFLSFYVLFCCVVVGGAIISFANSVMTNCTESLTHRMKEIADEYEHDHMDESERENKEEADTKKDRKTLFYHKKNGEPLLSPFMQSCIGCLLTLLVGAVVFSLAENCTCGFADTEVAGCDSSSLEACEGSGGHTKSFIDAWYMSCVSLTTIGFGDVSPATAGGRLFAVIWMTWGVVAMGNFAMQFSASFLEAQKVSGRLEMDVAALFDKIDVDKSGALDRFEFLTFALMEYGLVGEEDLEAVTSQFDMMDADKSGSVSKEEILAVYEKHRALELHKQEEKLIHRASVKLGLERPSVKATLLADPAHLGSKAVGSDGAGGDLDGGSSGLGDADDERDTKAFVSEGKTSTDQKVPSNAESIESTEDGSSAEPRPPNTSKSEKLKPAASKIGSSPSNRSKTKATPKTKAKAKDVLSSASESDRSGRAEAKAKAKSTTPEMKQTLVQK